MRKNLDKRAKRSWPKMSTCKRENAQWLAVAVRAHRIVHRVAAASSKTPSHWANFFFLSFSLIVPHSVETKLSDDKNTKQIRDVLFFAIRNQVGNQYATMSTRCLIDKSCFAWLKKNSANVHPRAQVRYSIFRFCCALHATNRVLIGELFDFQFASS